MFQGNGVLFFFISLFPPSFFPSFLLMEPLLFLFLLVRIILSLYVGHFLDRTLSPSILFFKIEKRSKQEEEGLFSSENYSV
jgi:hypothetical protein